MNVIFLLDNEIVYCMKTFLNVFSNNIYHTFIVVCALILNPARVTETLM